jgi:hypothetical protein
VLMAGVVWRFLPESPAAAKWLTDSQKKLHAADVSCCVEARGGEVSGCFELPPVSHPDTPHSTHDDTQMARTTHRVISQSPAHAVLHHEQLARPGASPWKLVWFTVINPFFLYMCFLGVLLAAAAQTYVFFLPMIISALVHGACWWWVGRCLGWIGCESVSEMCGVCVCVVVLVGGLSGLVVVRRGEEAGPMQSHSLAHSTHTLTPSHASHRQGFARGPRRGPAPRRQVRQRRDAQAAAHHPHCCAVHCGSGRELLRGCQQPEVAGAVLSHRHPSHHWG